jgi:hypothetical protein
MILRLSANDKTQLIQHSIKWEGGGGGGSKHFPICAFMQNIFITQNEKEMFLYRLYWPDSSWNEPWWNTQICVNRLYEIENVVPAQWSWNTSMLMGLMIHYLMHKNQLLDPTWTTISHHIYLISIIIFSYLVHSNRPVCTAHLMFDFIKGLGRSRDYVALHYITNRSCLCYLLSPLYCDVFESLLRN